MNYIVYTSENLDFWIKSTNGLIEHSNFKKAIGMFVWEVDEEMKKTSHYKHVDGFPCQKMIPEEMLDYIASKNNNVFKLVDKLNLHAL